MIDSEDVSQLIERLEAFEDRMDVNPEGLYASFTARSNKLYVNGELYPRTGTELAENIQLVVTLYDKTGRVSDTKTTTMLSKGFFGFQAFSAVFDRVQVPPLAKIRVYPKASGW